MSKLGYARAQRPRHKYLSTAQNHTVARLAQLADHARILFERVRKWRASIGSHVLDELLQLVVAQRLARHLGDRDCCWHAALDDDVHVVLVELLLFQLRQVGRRVRVAREVVGDITLARLVLDRVVELT